MKAIEDLVRRKLAEICLFSIILIFLANVILNLIVGIEKLELISPILHILEFAVIYYLCSEKKKIQTKTISLLIILLLFQITVENLFLNTSNSFPVFLSYFILIFFFIIDVLKDFNLYSFTLVILYSLSNKLEFTTDDPESFISNLAGMLTIIFACNILMGQRHYLVNNIFTKTKIKKQDSDASLSKKEMDDMSSEVLSYFISEKEYFTPDFKARSLASKLKMPLYKLSKVLNIGLGQSFNEIVNQHRLEEVKKRLISQQYQALSPLEIAFDCGFGTKSSFNDSFEKYTGMTPKEYRVQFTS